MSGVKKAFKRIFSKPKSKAAPPPPPPAPTVSAQDQENERKRGKLGQLLGGRGRGAVTGPQGLSEDSGRIGVKRLLGE